MNSHAAATAPSGDGRRWAAFVSVACGLASAAFLALLELVTNFLGARRMESCYLLPLAGLAIGAIYERWGSSIRAGNNLVIDTIHDDAPQIPLRMAPMVLIGTVLTHLFGGSAGREGTAVQMGASLADCDRASVSVVAICDASLLAAGVAGGFGSVFGTPIAGAIFGLEVVCLGRIEYDALVPALVASVVGDHVTRALGIVHTAYPAAPRSRSRSGSARQVARLRRRDRAGDDRLHRADPLHQAPHGAPCAAPADPDVRRRAAVVALWRLVGTSDYLGLGVPTIVRAFRDPHLPAYAFAAKLVFTAVTLGADFSAARSRRSSSSARRSATSLARLARDADRARRGGRPGGCVRRRREHAARALDHDGRAHGRRRSSPTSSS